MWSAVRSPLLFGKVSSAWDCVRSFSSSSFFRKRKKTSAAPSRAG
jgi:hypothetical protein